MVVLLLINDRLGAQCEDVTLPINANNPTAFAYTSRDPNNEQLIAAFDDKLIGILQLTYIPYLPHVGSWRCLIEGVRIDEKHMFEYAIQKARTRGGKLVQLTSDKQRPDAIHFYEKYRIPSLPCVTNNGSTENSVGPFVLWLSTR